MVTLKLVNNIINTSSRFLNAWYLAVFMMVVSDDILYVSLMVFSVPFGHFVKIRDGTENKQRLCSTVGLFMILVTCHFHVIHSLITTLINCLIVFLVSPRHCHVASFAWCFGYLVFFRTINIWGLPSPPALANAVQLLLTLRMVGLAFEMHDSHKRAQISEPDKETKLAIKYKSIDPSFKDVILYAYCYIGLLTGPYYKFRTYIDMVQNKKASQIPTATPMLNRLRDTLPVAIVFLVTSYFFSISYVTTDEFYIQPFWYRLFYMVPMFMIFRSRMYVAWILSECMCISAALGAYPAQCKSRCGQGPVELQPLDDLKARHPREIQFDFETIHNLSIYGCELAPTTRVGLRSWNMTVQYWLADNVYRRVPWKGFRVTITMGVSAFWHGVHPGYYLSFFTVPLILAAEDQMIAAFRTYRSPRAQKIFDWGCLFFKMRGFDYMCMGFLLLQLDTTIAYWSSIYFTGHIVTLVFFLVGYLLKPKIVPKKDWFWLSIMHLPWWGHCEITRPTFHEANGRHIYTYHDNDIWTIGLCVSCFIVPYTHNELDIWRT